MVASWLTTLQGLLSEGAELSEADGEEEYHQVLQCMHSQLMTRGTEGTIRVMAMMQAMPATTKGTVAGTIRAMQDMTSTEDMLPLPRLLGRMQG